jgi:hypothetical protein
MMYLVEITDFPMALRLWHAACCWSPPATCAKTVIKKTAWANTFDEINSQE